MHRDFALPTDGHVPCTNGDQPDPVARSAMCVIHHQHVGYRVRRWLGIAAISTAAGGCLLYLLLHGG